GQGVASGSVYFLPLREASPSREPEIAGIDVEKGVIVSRTRSRTSAVQGNLLFCEGDMLAQSAREVVAYPQLKVKIVQVDELIARNPKDPKGLRERADLRRDLGDLSGAVQDLRAAVDNEPGPQTRSLIRQVLYEVLTELLQRDFNAGEPNLKVYEELSHPDKD